MNNAAKINWCTLRKSALLALLLSPFALMAQQLPDAGAILRESSGGRSVLPGLPPAAKMESQSSAQGPKVLVRAFSVRGATKFTATELVSTLQDLQGQRLEFDELQAAADRISLYYRQKGLHALAVLPEQDLTSGQVEILVIEGKAGQFRFEYPEGKSRVPISLLTSIIQRDQAYAEILNLNSLERATLIANDIPGLRVSTMLMAGTQSGETDVVTRAEPLPLLSGSVSADNFDPAATGRNKLAGNMSINNALGIGDQVALAAHRADGKQYVSAGFSLPVNGDGLRAGITVSRLDYELQGQFASTGGKGIAVTWSPNLSYPFIRQQQTNLVGLLSYSASQQISDSQTGNTSDKKNRVWNVGLTFNRNDMLGDGGVSMAGLTFAYGVVDLSGNPAELAQDSAGVRRNGSFEKITYNAARLQRLGSQSMLWISTNGQAAFKNLDSAEEFSLGGPNAVRAYPALEGSGDEGQVVTLEYRYDLTSQLKGKVFYDWGRIRINHDNNFTGGNPINDYSLHGVGVGLDWSLFSQLNIRTSLAWRLGENPGAQANGSDNDGSRRVPQFWLYAQYDF